LTGMAHLFEHLMFGGTPGVPDFDTPLQLAGGENNAFTNNDITNYYITIPAYNIETAFWLESDRMKELDFSQKNLDTQKKVVIEEFNQRYLNQPYGDAILMLRPLTYKVHPYRWPAIGMDTAHISKATLDDIRDFFYSHYAPNNAVLSVTGNISAEKVKELSEKWFGPIERRVIRPRNIQEEPVQTAARKEVAERSVPSEAIYKAWHTCRRTSPDFFTLDLITDILAGGESGRLYTELVRGKKMFSEINAYITSDIDPGLLIVSGKLMKGISAEEAEKNIEEIVNSVTDLGNADTEIEKVRNKFEASTVFQNTSILNKAMNLAFYELLGDPEKINHEADLYRRVTAADVKECSGRYLIAENSSTLYYKSVKKS
jgi:zinc protease